jgi:hypothetical protein
VGELNPGVKDVDERLKKLGTEFQGQKEKAEETDKKLDKILSAVTKKEEE